MQPHHFPTRESAAFPVPADEVTALIAARRDLGPEAEDAVVAIFLEKAGRAIDARVEQRVAELRRERSGPSSGQSLALAIVSMGVGIPVTAIALGLDSGITAALAWATIAGVNFIFNRGKR
ncbi:hypothetical protein [Longispora albida]|uniref:hypothetical protein n=1 Tax=Longispora albida TaxID=203523 RepID=UPI0003635DDB|nr:hypothetical protein [Longispora albida]